MGVKTTASMKLPKGPLPTEQALSTDKGAPGPPWYQILSFWSGFVVDAITTSFIAEFGG